LCYSFQFGPLLREAGKSRPIARQAIARDFGQREVDRMMEQPGQWIGVEPGDDLGAICRKSKEFLARPVGMGNPPTPAAKPDRLPDVHPGCPNHATVRLVAKIVKRTPNATLIELPDDPRGKVWISRKHVLPGGNCGQYGCEALHVPVWLYRKIREQL
jgi:hypothetical protein